MLHLILTLAAGVTVGYLLQRLKVPGGMMIGSIIGTAALNIGFGAAYMPAAAKTVAQIIAGAFIGSSVKKQDLYRLRYIFKPAAILLSLYVLLNLAVGYVIYMLSPLDLSTALFCAVPGGINDIPLIAADMGADTPKVVVLQFVRLVIGIAVFPSVISVVCKDEEQKPITDNNDTTADSRKVPLPAALAIAFAFGVVGRWTGIPAGSLVLSLAATVTASILWGRIKFPIKIRRLAQLLAGAYIGCSFGMQDLLELRFLVLPVAALIIGYSVNCFITSNLLARFCGMTHKEGMLAATPAGASDMALISLDMGVQSADLVVLQILRLVVVSSLFPQMISLVLWLAG